MSQNSTNGKASDDTMVPPLTVRAQYTKDLSFENPHIIEMLTTLRELPHIAVDVHVESRSLGGDDVEVLLNLTVDAESAGKRLFLVELTYGGIFQVAAGVPEESVEPLLLIECPRLLFPFARQIIADVTREGGVPPVLLNPIDFVGLYHQRLPQAGEKQQTESIPGKN